MRQIFGPENFFQKHKGKIGAGALLAAGLFGGLELTDKHTENYSADRTTSSDESGGEGKNIEINKPGEAIINGVKFKWRPAESVAPTINIKQTNTDSADDAYYKMIEARARDVHDIFEKAESVVKENFPECGTNLISDKYDTNGNFVYADVGIYQGDDDSNPWLKYRIEQDGTYTTDVIIGYKADGQVVTELRNLSFDDFSKQIAFRSKAMDWYAGNYDVSDSVEPAEGLEQGLINFLETHGIRKVE